MLSSVPSPSDRFEPQPSKLLSKRTLQNDLKTLRQLLENPQKLFGDPSVFINDQRDLSKFYQRVLTNTALPPHKGIQRLQESWAKQQYEMMFKRFIQGLGPFEDFYEFTEAKQREYFQIVSSKFYTKEDADRLELEISRLLPHNITIAQEIRQKAEKLKGKESEKKQEAELKLSTIESNKDQAISKVLESTHAAMQRILENESFLELNFINLVNLFHVNQVRAHHLMAKKQEAVARLNGRKELTPYEQSLKIRLEQDISNFRSMPGFLEEDTKSSEESF